MRITVGVEAHGTLLMGLDNPGVIQKQWDECMYRALEASVVFWWKSLSPKKFQAGARSEYPGLFFVRKATTQRSKFRQYGHSTPLVTGFLNMPPRDRWTIYGAMKKPPSVKVLKRHKRASASWSAPKVSEVYKREVTAVNNRDVAALMRVFRANIIDGIRGARWRQSAIRSGVALHYKGPMKKRIMRTRLMRRRMMSPGSLVGL